MQPYMIDTQAFTFPSRRTGMPSAMEPASSGMSNTRPRRLRIRQRSSGKRQRAWVPNTRSTWRKDWRILSATCFSWAMQPHTQTIWSGFRRLVWTRAPRLPNTRCSACSRMAQVLRTITSASASLWVKAYPISER